MKNMIKDAAILVAITVIAGFILGFIYQNTKGLIAQREAQDKKEACLEVFNDAADFEEMQDCFTEEVKKAFEDNGYAGERIDDAAKALSESGEVLGYVLTITTSEGYGGDIQFTLGIQNDGTVNGISILSISETPGLGMQAEDVLKPQFKNKKVTQFAYTKTGATAENQIDAISGATITTNAVTNGVNAGLYYFETYLAGGSANE